jgi:hypothetical protein
MLVCAEQFQLRSPTTGAKTALGSYFDLAKEYQQIGLNAYQEAIATRLILPPEVASSFNTTTFLGPSALLANDNVFELVGTTLANNQCQIEVQGWFETLLARMQWFVLEWAANMANLGQYGYIVAPDRTSSHPVDKAAVSLCSLQRIRNTGAYQTFSFVRVMITVCVGFFFILLSWTLDWAVVMAKGGRRSRHPWRETARVADNKFQLLRKNLVDSTVDSTSYDALRSEDAWDDVKASVLVAKLGVRFWLPQPKGDDYYYDADLESIPQ